MITDSETNTVYLSNLLRTDNRFKLSFNQILNTLQSYKVVTKFLPYTNDIWARDYMPIQIDEKKYIEFRYDPDYLQGNSDDVETRELKTYTDIVCDSLGLKTIKTNIILDGGNAVKSKNSVILTDKIFWENRRLYDKKHLINELLNLFEVEKIIIIPWDEECEYGHSDGMLRFINEDTVLVSGYYQNIENEFKEKLIEALHKSGIKIEWLRCSEDETEENLAYINYLQTKNLLLIPKLGKFRLDEAAFEQIAHYYPTYKNNNLITQVEMNEIVQYGGALNCITWTTKE